MQRTPPFPFLPDLEMPLRDAMRGVASFAEATEEALEPAAKLLPEPLREGFHTAVKSIERTGKQLIDRPLQQDDIRLASAFAAGHRQDDAAARVFAKVVSFGWEHVHADSHAHRCMISETILASKLTHITASTAGPAHAAGLVETIRKSSAIGRMPGISDGIDADERSQIDLALVAILVWLLATRGDTAEDELTLLDLAMALITAIRGDVTGAIDDQAKIADILQNASAHL